MKNLNAAYQYQYLLANKLAINLVDIGEVWLLPEDFNATLTFRCMDISNFDSSL